MTTTTTTSTKVNNNINTWIGGGVGMPPPAKRRRIDTIDHDEQNTTSTSTSTSSRRIIDASSILETREILEGIHRFLRLEEILQSRLVCKLWNEYFKFRIEISQLTASGSDCDLFPLYMREMFEASIGRFEAWFLFLICEYTNNEFKLKLKLKSSMIYPALPQHEPVCFSLNSNVIDSSNLAHYNYVPRCSRSSYPQQTRYNLLANDKKQYKLYEKLLTIFMFERHKQCNVNLHNILFAWLRGLKPLALYWLDLYDIHRLPQDLNFFHRTLSTDYIEPECGSIPVLQSTYLTKYDYLSSFLGLLTMNGDFELFDKLYEKITTGHNSGGGPHSLSTLFPKQHFPNHVYQHKHTFGFAYNVYGLCHYPLIDTALQICDIPRSVCSLKVIRFVLLPHILVNIQSDLALHKYHIPKQGNILAVSLMKRLVTIRKFCFYFDLCATIHSSNLNRANSEEYLVYTQLKHPFASDDDTTTATAPIVPDTQQHGGGAQSAMDGGKPEEQGQLLHNFHLWKRYMLLCHLLYFIEKFQDKMDIEQYIRVLFAQRPKSITEKAWVALFGIMHKVQIIYPKLRDILAAGNVDEQQHAHQQQQRSNININNNDSNSNSNNKNNRNNSQKRNHHDQENTNSHQAAGNDYVEVEETDSCFVQIETFLKQQYNQYLGAVVLLDCIGGVYGNDENPNRSALGNLERRGPTTLEEFELFKECVLASQDVRRYYLMKYDLDALYHAIQNVSFHDRDLNVGQDLAQSTGLMLRHGL